MTPELLIKIANYISENNLASRPQSEVLSEMVSSGLITQSELEEIKDGNIYSLSSKSDINFTDSVEVSSSSVSTAAPSSESVHPVFKDIRLNPDGKVDMEQFSLEALKKKYPDEKFEITTTKDKENALYIVVDKVSNKPVYRLLQEYDDINSQYSYCRSFYDKNGKVIDGVTFKDGKLYSVDTYGENGSVTSTIYKDGDMSKIESIYKVKENGNTVLIEYENGHQSVKTDYNKNGEFISQTLYNNGELYAEVDKKGEILFNYSSQNLIKKITTDNYPWINSALSNLKENEILNEISKFDGKKLVEVLEGYIIQSNDKNLFNEILDMNVLGEDAKKHIIQKLDKIGLSYQTNDEFKNEYIALRFAASVEGNHYDKNLLSYINTDNVKNVVSFLGNYDVSTGDDNIKIFSDKTPVRMINFSDITSEEKKQATDYILNLLYKYAENNEIFCDDIKKDIELHRNEFDKFDIDFRRLVSRLDADSNTEVSSKINGKIDETFEQNATGDCWLVTGMNGIKSKPGGLDILNGLLTPDDKRQILTVEFPYSQVEKHSIDYNRIYKSNYFVSSEPDARGIECAIDDYIKQRAYSTIENPTENDLIFNNQIPYRPSVSPYDTYIDGGNVELFFELVLGNSKHVKNADMYEMDFNDPKQVFEFSYDEGEMIQGFDYDTKEPIEIDKSHSYNITSSDGNFIFLQDPRDPDINIAVNRDNFRDSNSEITSAYLRKSDMPTNQ